jgi:hypothetical protein
MHDIEIEEIRKCESHPLCMEFLGLFPEIESVITYRGNNPVIATALGASLPSPDGLEWDEFHHIPGRRYGPHGRLISRPLHLRAHSGRALEIPLPEVKFHCLEPAREWAEAYLQGRHAVSMPQKPIQVMWDIRINDLIHRSQGANASNAVQEINEFVSLAMLDYIHTIRSLSWDTSGTIYKYNISPSEHSPNNPLWAKFVKQQINNWYSLGSGHSQYLNNIVSVFGHLGNPLFMNGFSYDEIKNLMKSHRMARAIYRIAQIINTSEEDKEILADQLKTDLEETAELSDNQRSAELTRRWPNNQQVQNEQLVSVRRKAFYTADKIFLVTSMPNTEEEFNRISEVFDMVEIEFDLELLDGNI